MHTLQPSNEMNILLAVYLTQLGYNYDDVLWMLLPPPGNMHWLTPETTKEHHIYWGELSPTREQSGLYDYLPPAPSPAVASTPHRSGSAVDVVCRSGSCGGYQRPHQHVGCHPD